jgi:phosphoglycerate dehydrogenase-like enzyme
MSRTVGAGTVGQGVSRMGQAGGTEVGQWDTPRGRTAEAVAGLVEMRTGLTVPASYGVLLGLSEPG